GFSALAFDPAGTLYAIQSVSSGNVGRLLTVDPVTGMVLTSISLNRRVGDVAGLAFDPETGVPYVADGLERNSVSQLYTLDTSSGVLTPVGDLGLGLDGLSGLAFTNGIVPEPTIAALLGLPILAMVARRRRV